MNRSRAGLRPRTTRQPLVALVLAVAVLAAGCSTAPPDNAGAAQVTGRLLRADGTPAAGMPVVVAKEAKSGDLANILFSFGVLCLADSPPAGCKSSTATTSADGTYRIGLKSHSTQAVYDLAAGGRRNPDGTRAAVVAARLDIPADTAAVPDLRLWESPIDLSGPASRARAAWSPPSSAGGSVGYTLAFPTLARGDVHDPVWSFEAGDHGTPFDARVLEDSSVVATVTADLERRAAPRPLIGLTWTAPEARLPFPVGPPPSRGRPCSFGDAAGHRAAQVPCLVTDGKFDQPAFAKVGPQCPATLNAPPQAATAVPATATAVPDPTTPACQQPAVTDVVVDLGTVRPVSLVVARGCPFGCDLEASANGTTWTHVGRVDGTHGEDGLAEMPTPVPARYVRARSSASATFVRELTAW